MGKIHCIIKCCDVLEFLRDIEDESIDLVIADPPYNSTIEWDRKDDEWQVKWLKEVKRVMKDGASLYVFFAPMNMYGVEGWIRKNLTLKNVIVWYHQNLYGSGLSYGDDRYKSTWDVVFYAVKGKKAKHGKKISSVAYSETGKGFDVMEYPQPRPLMHKAQKPLELIKKFVICSSNEGDWVLDPFVGSGTTAIVCKYLNRNFMGCEKNEEFYELTRRRLRYNGRLKEFDIIMHRSLKRRQNADVSEDSNEQSVLFKIY